MASSAGRSTMPLPFTIDEIDAGDSSVVVNHLNDRESEITIKINRNLLRDVLDRWTWNSGTITIAAGDKSQTIIFPKIGEQLVKR